MFGALGGGMTIWAGGTAALFSLIIIGPGAELGAINGGTRHGWGMEMTMDGGGPDGMKIGGGLRWDFGKFINMGPGEGPGTMTCADGGGRGGSWVKTVSGIDPGGGRRPDPDKVFSSGNITGGGIEEIAEGEAVDTAASNMRTEIGCNSLSVAGDDEIAFNRSVRVDDGKALKSWGVADSVFAIDTSAGVGKDLSVEDEQSVVSKETIGCVSSSNSLPEHSVDTATGTARIPLEL